MNKKEKEILELEESVKDTIENDIITQQQKNKKIIIKEIRLIGEIQWKDNETGRNGSDKLYEVEKEIIEIDEDGNERKTIQMDYYLGNKCIAGTIGLNQIVYKESFREKNQDLIEDIDKKIEENQGKDENSLNKLKEKELSEVLSAKPKKEENDKNDLTEKEAEQIKVNGIQRVDLNKLVDGKETLGKRLDLDGYDSLYIVYSEKVGEITKGEKINNTTYSLVGMTNDGQAKVLNDEFEMDSSVGNNASRKQTKIRANNIATRDNKDLSVYTRKTNKMSIGCENNKGRVDMFLYQKTMDENENVGIQIETSQTQIIPIETREIMNRNKGIYQKENVQNEIQEHTDQGCNPENRKDYDGDEKTSTHNHIKIDELVERVMENTDDKGEQKIKEVFTENEVKDKIIREINKEQTENIEDVIEAVTRDLNIDAQNLSRGHRR